LIKDPKAYTEEKTASGKNDANKTGYPYVKD
jgi:hypothetical protein